MVDPFGRRWEIISLRLTLKPWPPIRSTTLKMVATTTTKEQGAIIDVSMYREDSSLYKYKSLFSRV